MLRRPSVKCKILEFHTVLELFMGNIQALATYISIQAFTSKDIIAMKSLSSRKKRIWNSVRDSAFYSKPATYDSCTKLLNNTVTG